MNSPLEQFRNDVYKWFPHRPDALMDLLDALASNTAARSVVELSVSPVFRRGYSSVHDGIEHLFVPDNEESQSQERQELELALVRLLIPYLPTPQRSFWLLGTDVTSASRPFARTLRDRTFVYQPNQVKGVKPVTIGHQYSILAMLPEKSSPGEPLWVIPLLVNRVTSVETKREAGLAQIHRLLEDETLPFHEQFCVNVGDSDYSAVTYLGGVAPYPNLVTVARFAGNRTVYRKPSPASAEAPATKGHPTWFGASMSLKDPTTWDAPDEVADTTFTTRKGQSCTVQIEAWHDMLVRGKRDLPMHQHPFTLVRGRVLDAQGKMVFTRPLWLVVLGKRRQELSLLESWDAYRQRYDLEHFLRFGKQRLLMDAYQTPETEHEENWWTLVQLAYLQLWFAREHANKVPRPWERYLPRFRAEDKKSPSVEAPSEDKQSSPVASSVEGEQSSPIASPSDVQRDLTRILRHIGTPARDPKRRGNAPGRSAGQSPKLRVRLPVIKKSVRKSQQQRAP
jgi:hypothetical protein